MNTMWKLFTGDIKRLTSNVVSIIIVIGLVMIPGLFTGSTWPHAGTRSRI